MKLCQLLGQLGVFLTFAATTGNSEERDKRERERRETCGEREYREEQYLQEKTERRAPEKSERSLERENRGRREEKGRAC